MKTPKEYTGPLSQLQIKILLGQLNIREYRENLAIYQGLIVLGKSLYSN